MTDSEARELEGVLSERVPGGNVSVIPEKDGALVVIEVNGGAHSYNIGNPPSALLNHLLAGYAV